MDGGKKVPASLLEVGGALILLAWRLAWYPPVHFPNDWVLVLSLCWISQVCIPRPGFRTAILLLGVLWLFAVYSLQHLPLALDHLRLVL
jgi:hypothetical protein